MGFVIPRPVVRRSIMLLVSVALVAMTLIGLVIKLISDLCYLWVDPRVKFD